MTKYLVEYTRDNLLFLREVWAYSRSDARRKIAEMEMDTIHIRSVEALS